MGIIPEDAVPESVATAETCVASERAVSATCSVCGASLSYTTILVNGRSVYCYKWISGGYSATDIASLDNGKEYVLSENHTLDIPYGEDLWCLESTSNYRYGEKID